MIARILLIVAVMSSLTMNIFAQCRTTTLRQSDTLKLTFYCTECDNPIVASYAIYGGAIYASSDDSAYQKLTTEYYDTVVTLLSKFPFYFFKHKQEKDTACPACWPKLGCPDCYDQGGIYLSIDHNGKYSYWDVDIKLKSLPKPIRAYISKVKIISKKLWLMRGDRLKEGRT